MERSVATKGLGDTFLSALSGSPAPEIVEQPKAASGSSCGCGSAATVANGSPTTVANGEPTPVAKKASTSSCCGSPPTGTKV